jgi:hypothetical protein
MARRSGLERRVAAIVDGSRSRRLQSATAIFFLAAVGAITLCLGASHTNSISQTANESSALREQQIARLKMFSELKAKQSAALAAAAGEKISPEFEKFFTAASGGDWQMVTNMYESFKQRHPQYAKSGQRGEATLRTSYWGPVLEILLAYDHVVRCEPEYTRLAVDGMMNVIPQGSIYFGGTDPGRGLPTAFSKSHVDADPFYTLTQNALADGTYLEYLRKTYGELKPLLNQLAEAHRADTALQALTAKWFEAVQKMDALRTNAADPQFLIAEKNARALEAQRDERTAAIFAGVQTLAKAAANSHENTGLYIPTAQDQQKCFLDYVQDAQQRLHKHQLKPGEDFKEEGGSVQIGGQAAVMAINGLLVKIIFDKNPGHEFFIEESFPLDWMYPHLEPHALIFKINRQPLAELSAASVQTDRDFWQPQVNQMIGGWLKEDK